MQMQRFPHFLDNQLTDGSEVISLTHQPWLEGLGQLNNPITSLGIEHHSFWFVA
jgi:hypothetical protein